MCIIAEPMRVAIRLMNSYLAPDLSDMVSLAGLHRSILKVWPLLKVILAVGKYGPFRRQLMAAALKKKKVIKKGMTLRTLWFVYDFGL